MAGLVACAPLQSDSGWAATNFSALVKAHGPAVVNIGVRRDATPARRVVDPLTGRLYEMVPPGDKVDESSLGSGFIVSDDGFILTNAHVVAQGVEINVRLTDRREFKARLVGMDAVSDIALLKIDAKNLPMVAIGDPGQTQVGDWAVAIGSPYGFSNSVSAGIISAKGRVLPGADHMPFLQTDVPVNPGNSGGPLFDLRGKVIGINSRIYSRNGGYQGLSFAIPIDMAMRIKAQLQATGMVTRGRIGFSVQEVNQALAHSFRLPKLEGALVSYVEPGGAADRAGLKAGDVILRVNRKDVVQSVDAVSFIADASPGQTIPLAIWRDRAETVLSVTVERFDTPTIPFAETPSAGTPLGMVLRPLLPQELAMMRVPAGLLVQRVNAAAARAGVQIGDVILALNGHAVASVEALAAEVSDGDGAVALLVQRAGARIFVPICAKAGSIGC